MNTEILQGDYRISIGQDSIYIQHINMIKKVLVIEKFTSNIYETDVDILNKVIIYGSFSPHAILGILRIRTYDFLVYVKIAQVVGIFDGSEIYKIKEPETIAIADETIASNLRNDIKSLLSGIKQFLSLGFFYSFKYDLTNSRQKLSKLKLNNIIDSTEKKYFWNHNLYKKFFEKNVDKIWMVPTICGYVGITNQIVSDNTLSLILIARRSVYHAGTRYNTRGIDDDGHCANYVEIEQMLKYQNFILSYVQLRGSGPIFFQQPGMTAQTVITRTSELTTTAFLKHIDEMKKDFSMTVMINLMNVNKPNEQIITLNYENQVKLYNNKNSKYFFFDFQNECKSDNYDKIDVFIGNIENIFNIFKFYCEDALTGKIYKEQIGVIRTNCLDCLDRTNVIQTKIAWKMLEMQVS